MATREPQAPGEIYHIYNRGTEKRNIFANQKDYERFTALLHLCNSAKTAHMGNLRGSTLPELLSLDKGEPLVDIAAYCLMPNHFHLLVRQREEGGISKFMQKLITGYTMYFNKKNDRSGALFQGKYKSKHAGEDRYLKYLLAYIHLNPYKLIGKIPRFDLGTPQEYKYSSYADFMGTIRPENILIVRDALPLYFPTANDFKKELHEWLTLSPD